MTSLLIVEDEYLVRQGIRRLVDFDRLDITDVDEAENGKQAWELFQEKRHDVVLTDINMPVMDGLSLAKAIKEIAPQTRLVFLTGYDTFDYAVTALKLGADDYLLKPFSKDDVEKMLAAVLSKLHSEQKRDDVTALLREAEDSDLAQSIQNRLSDSALSLKGLAQDLGFNPNYLSSLIKKELGQPFQDYVSQERFKRAKLLLLTTDLKIYEVAQQVGFDDMNYFSQRFKQVTGVSPRAFKKGGHL